MEGTMEKKFADIDIPESKIQFFKSGDLETPIICLLYSEFDYPWAKENRDFIYKSAVEYRDQR